MEPGSLVLRLKQTAGSDSIPELDRFDPDDDLHIDRAAAVLLDRFRAEDDTEALSLLFELAHHKLAVLARRVSSRFSLAIDPEDLVAAFMTRLFTDVRRPLPTVRNFLGLAFTSMRNDALNQLRSHDRAMRRLEVVGRRGQSVVEDAAAQLDRREQLASLTRVGTLFLGVVSVSFHSLRERDRRVLLAREVKGMSYDELAASLELPVNQVGSILRRARHRLADRIARALSPDRDEETT